MEGILSFLSGGKKKWRIECCKALPWFRMEKSWKKNRWQKTRTDGSVSVAEIVEIASSIPASRIFLEKDDESLFLRQSKAYGRHRWKKGKVNEKRSKWSRYSSASINFFPSEVGRDDTVFRMWSNYSTAHIGMEQRTVDKKKWKGKERTQTWSTSDAELSIMPRWS